MSRVRELLTVLLVVAAGTSIAQEGEVWVNVLIKGKAVMAFLPAESRSGHSQRGVCSEVDEAGAKTNDGLPIRAFEFTGWKDGGGYRVMVFAIVPTREAGSQGLCAEGTGFKRVAFEDLRLQSGKELVISKMKEAGMTPWVIKAGRKEAMRR